ncbi:hypothetical protein, partial [Glaciihabitans sp. UYNi722]|uniref:hypothetical protein n=1 Tax=Glaciihabitans sp. UYNi722 TaxID=3156344 RepID=UPI0033944570
TSLPIRQNKNHNPRWPYFQLAKVALFSVGVNKVECQHVGRIYTLCRWVRTMPAATNEGPKRLVH